MKFATKAAQALNATGFKAVKENDTRVSIIIDDYILKLTMRQYDRTDLVSNYSSLTSMTLTEAKDYICGDSTVLNTVLAAKISHILNTLNLAVLNLVPMGLKFPTFIMVNRKSKTLTTIYELEILDSDHVSNGPYMQSSSSDARVTVRKIPASLSRLTQPEADEVLTRDKYDKLSFIEKRNYDRRHEYTKGVEPSQLDLRACVGYIAVLVKCNNLTDEALGFYGDISKDKLSIIFSHDSIVRKLPIIGWRIQDNAMRITISGGPDKNYLVYVGDCNSSKPEGRERLITISKMIDLPMEDGTDLEILSSEFTFLNF